MNVWYQSCNIVSDTSVWNDNSRIGICKSIEDNFIKFLKISFSGIDTLSIWNLKIPFNLLLVSMIGLLTFNFYFKDRFSIDSWCYSLLEEYLVSNSELMIWLEESK